MQSAETVRDVIRKRGLITGERCDGKLSCTVREEGDGKGHHRVPRRRPTSLGGRAEETGRPVGRYRASARPYTWLPGPVRGQFYYLFLILDLYSRKIVGWEVHERESAALGAEVVERAVLAEGCINQPLVLHSDNGSPMKGATMLETLRRLEIEPSFSRPRVSNDNPFSEAVFRTCKYVPDFPTEGFASLEAAREWGHDFVRWYNEENRHSRIRYVTPQQRHNGEDAAILAEPRPSTSKPRPPILGAGVAKRVIGPQPGRYG